ncbi:MAG: T9SS type A sorting domain-containing protein [Bacteroidia bacterium]
MKNLAIIVLSLFYQNLQGQSLDRFVIGTTGAFGTNISHQIEYTVGELITPTITNSAVILNQGFHQSNPPYNTGIDPGTSGISYVLYPNPTGETAFLELESAENIQLRLELWDSNGRMIPLKPVIQPFSGKKQIELDLTTFSSGLYLLRISDQEGKLVKTLKLEKQ